MRERAPSVEATGHVQASERAGILANIHTQVCPRARDGRATLPLTVSPPKDKASNAPVLGPHKQGVKCLLGAEHTGGVHSA